VLDALYKRHAVADVVASNGDEPENDEDDEGEGDIEVIYDDTIVELQDRPQIANKE
jgi:hypothetical protein